MSMMQNEPILAKCSRHRDHSIQIKGAKKLWQGIAGTRSFNMGLALAEGKKLERFKWTAVDIFQVDWKSGKLIML